MRKFFYSIALLMLASAALTFTSCEKKDEDENVKIDISVTTVPNDTKDDPKVESLTYTTYFGQDFMKYLDITAKYTDEKGVTKTVHPSTVPETVDLSWKDFYGNKHERIKTMYPLKIEWNFSKKPVDAPMIEAVQIKFALKEGVTLLDTINTINHMTLNGVVNGVKFYVSDDSKTIGFECDSTKFMDEIIDYLNEYYGPLKFGVSAAGHVTL